MRMHDASLGDPVIEQPEPITLFLPILEASLRRARRGPWRAEVAEGSMAPALLPGDWLLLDPTGRRWPRPGSIVVIREPGSGVLAIKRVAARGSRSRERTATATVGPGRTLEPREAWLLGDAPASSIDSRAYGTVAFVSAYSV